MKSSGTYKCAGVIPWVNEMYAPLHGIPFNLPFVRKMMGHLYATPTPPMTDLIIACPEDTSKWDPLSQRGALKFANPPEILHALWLAIARDIDAKVADSVLDAWR
eukprot:6978805-Alexandrium_andersonii.AAC.1